MTRMYEVTRFNRLGDNIDSAKYTWNDFCNFIHSAPYNSKASAPWIKLAGIDRSKANVKVRDGVASYYYRNNPAVQFLSGIEGDYDGGSMTAGEACTKLTSIGLRALVVTTHSATESNPRWRVFVPFADDTAVLEHGYWMARLNGILSDGAQPGILSPESFTLCQSYAVGRNAETGFYECFATGGSPEFGRCLDELDKVVQLPTSSRMNIATKDGADMQVFSAQIDELEQQLREGNNVNLCTLALTARRLRNGEDPDEIERDMLTFTNDIRVARGETRARQYVSEVKRCIEGGKAKGYTTTMTAADAERMCAPLLAAAHRTWLFMETFGLQSYPGTNLLPEHELQLQAWERQQLQPTAPPPVMPVESGVLLVPIEEGVVPALPAPYPGAMSLLVETCLAHSARKQPEMATMGALIGMASNVTARWLTPSGRACNLYGLIVAESGAGKDEVMTLAQHAKGADTDRIGKIASAAGVEDWLSPYRSLLMVQDEVGSLLSITSQKRPDPLQQDIHDKLLMLYTCGHKHFDIRVTARRTKEGNVKKQDSVERATMNILGATVPEKFDASLTDESIESGFYGRMLVVEGRRGVRLSNIRRQRLSYDEAYKMRPQWPHGALHQFIQCYYTQEAEAMFEAMCEHCDTVSHELEHKARAALVRRTAEKVERIATVLAVWKGTPEVGVQELRWAWEFVMHSNGVLMKRFGNSCHTESGKAERKIVCTLFKYMTGACKVRDGEREMISQGHFPVSYLKNLLSTTMEGNVFSYAVEGCVQLGWITRYNIEGKTGGSRSMVTLTEDGRRMGLKLTSTGMG